MREDEDAKILIGRMIELIENTDYKPEVQEEKKTPEKPATQAPAAVAPKEASKLYLRVPDLNSREYLKAKNLVDIFEGGVQVIFFDTSNKKYLPYSHGIELTEFIHSELCMLLGKENVVVKS